MLLAILLAVEAALKPFVKIDAPAVVLEHVRVIDGTGAPPREDQTLYIVEGKLAASAPAGAQRIDLRDHTVFPGLVGMHDHIFYPAGGAIFHEMARSFPRLYLAAGVTTIRTAGSIEPYTDLELKREIDSGKQPGPRMYVTGPYIEGKGTWTPQMHQVRGPDDARRTVEFWAGQGATSFKLYNFLTRAEAGAAIDAAHKLGLKVTGHLCSIGFTEAAQLGIDDLEHGLFVDTEFFAGKKPDECPAQEALKALQTLSAGDPRVGAMIAELVKRRVAVTSTLAVFEAAAPARFDKVVTPRVLDALSPDARSNLLARHTGGAQREDRLDVEALLKLEMQFERAFAKAGGQLLAGCDPTGNGAALAGYGDQREVELLVEAGFTPIEALKIASFDGALWLGAQERIGAIGQGRDADLVVVKGDPSRNISDIEKIEIVFKEGVAYDPQKLVESVRGLVGIR